jgi:hypothetical protein
MSERKTRVWLASLLMGLTTSLILTGAMLKMSIGFWFPPFWPGLFFSLVCGIVGHGQQWDSRIALAIIIVGNAAFYAWIFLHAFRAEVAARGSLSRYFLR